MKISRIIDLSHPVTSGMPVYPGDPTVSVWPATTIAADGFNVLHLAMGSQSGTHIDAPYHFIEDGSRIDQFDPSTFIGPAVVADCSGLSSNASIGADRIPERLEGTDILLLHTGWSTHWGSEQYFHHPYLSVEAAHKIVGEGYSLIAIDALSVDSTQDSDHGFPAHMIILGKNIPICENLTGLDQVTWPHPIASVLPLKLSGADGSPIRAVAFEAEIG
jgi:kynurenine formamidase